MSTQDSYGFRLGSNNATIAAKGQEWFEAATNSDVMAIVGCAAGYASNIRRDVSEKTGWSIAGRDTTTTTERKPAARVTKVKGCLPFKTASAIARILDLDPEETDIGWHEFQQAMSKQSEPENWIGLLFHRLGGESSGGGVEFRAWIDSNTAIDAAKAAAELKGPTTKIGKALKTALSHAETLESPEMALAIAALMSRFGFQTETESDE